MIKFLIILIVVILSFYIAIMKKDFTIWKGTGDYAIVYATYGKFLPKDEEVEALGYHNFKYIVTRPEAHELEFEQQYEYIKKDLINMKPDKITILSHEKDIIADPEDMKRLIQYDLGPKISARKVDFF